MPMPGKQRLPDSEAAIADPGRPVILTAIPRRRLHPVFHHRVVVVNERLGTLRRPEKLSVPVIGGRKKHRKPRHQYRQVKEIETHGGPEFGSPFVEIKTEVLQSLQHVQVFTQLVHRIPITQANKVGHFMKVLAFELLDYRQARFLERFKQSLASSTKALNSVSAPATALKKRYQFSQTSPHPERPGGGLILRIRAKSGSAYLFTIASW